MKVKVDIHKSIELQTNDADKILILSGFEKLGGDSIKCHIILKSRRFGYDGSVTFDNILVFINAIETMGNELKGSAELKEDYNDNFIKFEITNLGHVIVSGTFVEYSEHSQNMSFEFKTDQTCLLPFSGSLKGLFK